MNLHSDSEINDMPKQELIALNKYQVQLPEELQKIVWKAD